jgi:hypothetical protein
MIFRSDREYTCLITVNVKAIFCNYVVLWLVQRAISQGSAGYAQENDCIADAGRFGICGGLYNSAHGN